MKKILLITFLLLFSFSFAQQSEREGINGIYNKEVPKTITVVSASPNPFTAYTSINFKSSEPQAITFSVKNLLGKIVYSENIRAKQGINKIPFRRNSLQRGMYIYTLQTENEIVSKRFVIK